jgi:cell wall-associated NlpC family hydrolase
MTRIRRGHRVSTGNVPPLLRPVVWSATVSAAVTFAFAATGHADPALPDTVPDPGARPVPAGAVRLPGAAPATGTTGPAVQLPPSLTGPLARQIFALESEIDTLAEQLLKLRQARDTAVTERGDAQNGVDMAAGDLAHAQRSAETAAAEAFKQAAALPPGTFGSDLHDLDELRRIQRGADAGTDLTAPAREVARAQSALHAAQARLDTAEVRAQAAQSAFTQAEQVYQLRVQTLSVLRRRNADQLAIIERDREAAEQQIGAGIIGDGSTAGLAANPRALAAVRFALAQLGDPYVWGAEGPDEYDCSGLTWAAYRAPGADFYSLPRVAKDQYWATRSRTVDRGSLLPGDLIFFASGSDWGTIHHVGIYIGGGKMVHAPNSNETVKVSTVWWSRFYAATRIFTPVPAPAPAPTTPRPTPLPTKKPTPSATPSTPPTRPPTRPPTAPPTTGTPSTPPGPTPTVNPTPAASGSPAPSGSPTAIAPTTSP